MCRRHRVKCMGKFVCGEQADTLRLKTFEVESCEIYGER